MTSKIKYKKQFHYLKEANPCIICISKPICISQYNNITDEYNGFVLRIIENNLCKKCIKIKEYIESLDNLRIKITERPMPHHFIRKIVTGELNEQEFFS